MLIKATTTQLLSLVREASPKVIEANLKTDIFNLTLWFQHCDDSHVWFTHIEGGDTLWDYSDLANNYEGRVWCIYQRAC